MGAFVVFNHEESVKRCLADYSKKNFLTRCCFGQHKALRFRGKHTLRVTPADKPGNIIWENINIGKGELRIRKFVALAVTLRVLLWPVGLLLKNTILRSGYLLACTQSSMGVCVVRAEFCQCPAGRKPLDVSKFYRTLS